MPRGAGGIDESSLRISGLQRAVRPRDFRQRRLERGGPDDGGHGPVARSLPERLGLPARRGARRVGTRLRRHAPAGVEGGRARRALPQAAFLVRLRDSFGYGKRWTPRRPPEDNVRGREREFRRAPERKEK